MHSSAAPFHDREPIPLDAFRNQTFELDSEVLALPLLNRTLPLVASKTCNGRPLMRVSVVR